MNVLIGFHLDYRESSVAIDAEQIDDASLTSGELRDLSIERRRVNHGVEPFNLRPDLRFEPRFGMAQEDRVAAGDRLGSAHPGEFLGDAFGLDDVGLTAGGVFVIEAEQQFVACDAREFEPSYSEADGAVRPVATCNAIDSSQAIDPFDRAARGSGERLHRDRKAGVEVLIIARIDQRFVVNFMHEYQVLGCGRAEMPNAMAGGSLESRGQKNRERVDGDLLLAAPEMVEQNEPEAEGVAGRERFLRRADGGDAGSSTPQQRSWKTGRQSVLQVLLRAELGDTVSGKLPLQGAAKPFPILEPRAAPVGIAIRGIGEVEQG